MFTLGLNNAEHLKTKVLSAMDLIWIDLKWYTIEGIALCLKVEDCIKVFMAVPFFCQRFHVKS